MILSLCGGVGGAKLALGLYRALPPDTLKVAVNTGDDFTHLGLEIWPDFDTVLYTLAGLADLDRGWGRSEESWTTLNALVDLGAPDWFQLGDKDLAVHLVRADALRRGESRLAIARDLARRAGVAADIFPATDPVATMLETEDGVLPFQDYFVRRRCAPAVRAVSHSGAETASPSRAFLDALHAPALRGIVIAPSNPLLSLGPTLAVPEAREALKAAPRPVIAVSPIVAGAALKGPAAKIMNELGIEVSPLGVARLLGDVIDCLVIDAADAELAGAVRATGIDCLVTETVMTDEADKVRLAKTVIDWLG